ncbi:hypothetical protein C8024_19155 [Sphingopyxis sp. BSNA05]|nr:hypothetical protein [Sphingopyxis sp. BSNA05]
MLEIIWQFGISPVISDLLQYYRTLSQWALGWIGWPWSWRLSLVARDILGLQLLCAGILLRSGAIRDLTVRSANDNIRPAGPVLKFLFLATPLGIFCCYSALQGVIMSPFAEDDRSSSLSKQVLPFVLSSILALFVIFAFNAYGVSAVSM